MLRILTGHICYLVGTRRRVGQTLVKLVIGHYLIKFSQYSLAYIVLTGNNCGHPGDIADGTVAGGFLYNDTVTYICNSGFNMTSGDSHHTCQANGSWTGIKPNCSSKLIKRNFFLSCENAQPIDLVTNVNHCM